MLKRNSMRFAAALLTALASFVAVPNAALAAAPEHHDQVPGFYRMKVGDLRPIGRDTQGVRLMDLAEGDKIVSIATLTEPDTDESDGPKTE